MKATPSVPSAFVLDTQSPRVVFGWGARLHVADELERLGAHRALLISTPGRAQIVAQLRERLGRRLSGVFDGARQHVPTATLELGRAAERTARADCYVSIGGGSATGLAKALALDSGLPILAVPTTYAGSEVTAIWGITDGQKKITGRDERVLPRVVIYDPELTMNFPRPLAGSSGMNAIAHCVEAMYAPDANPVTSLLAEEGIRVLAAALPQLSSGTREIETRTAAMYGAYLGGTALAAVSMGLHHRICHVLGGAFALPHAEMHAVMLPHVLALKSRSDPRVERVAAALSAASAPRALRELARAAGAPGSLREIGLNEAQMNEGIALLAGLQDPDGGQLQESDARVLLNGAFSGALPRRSEPGERR